MIPRFGNPPVTNTKYTLRPGAYAILPLGRHVLLTAQVQDLDDVQLPGGGIDPGESPLRALHREVFEETGWVITRPQRLGAFRRFVFMPEYDLMAEKLCHIFIARPCYQKSEPSDLDHITQWASPARAVRLLGNAGDRAFLANHLL